MHTLRRLFLHPFINRIAYDLLVSLLTAFLSWFFIYVIFMSGVIFQESVIWPLWLTPVLFVGLNFILGIYGRYRLANGPRKTVLLSISILVVSLLLGVACHDVRIPLLWVALTWGPVVLPRLFLNMNRQTRFAQFKTAIKSRGPVLVVGGAGYIGTHVVEQLLKAGFPVRVLDKLAYGEASLKDFIGNPSFEFVNGDATNLLKLNMAINGASAVIHMAGLVGDPACAVDEKYTRHTNVISTRMVKEVARSLGVPRFIFASSCSVYGMSDEPVNENSSLNPVSLYARTKIDSEKEILSSLEDDFTVTILRFATVFGHSRRPRFDLVVNLFTAQAFVDGKVTLAGPKQWRPFVHVRDLARAIVMVLQAPPSRVQGEVFNVGDNRMNTTIGDLADMVKKIVGKERKVEIIENKDFKDLRNYFVSFDKIKSVLGFECETNLETGIEEMVSEFRKGTYKYYRENTYSNLEMTKITLPEFYDPINRTQMYSTIEG